MAKYIKLGEKAEGFYDSTTRTKVTKGIIVEISNKVASMPRLKRALIGGHLTRVEKHEYEKFCNKGKVKETIKSAETEGFTEDMTKSELTEYYSTTYDVDEEEIQVFSKLNKELMLGELTELAKEE